jgi:hypothetical protein
MIILSIMVFDAECSYSLIYTNFSLFEFNK